MTESLMSEYTPYTYKGYPRGLKYPYTYPVPSLRERDRRWREIRRSMGRHNLDCLIIGTSYGFMPWPGHTYVQYVSNYSFHTIGGTFVVFPLEGEPFLAVTTSFGPQFMFIAYEASWIKDIQGSLNPAQDIVNKIKELGLEKGRIGIVGYREMIFPAVVYDGLCEKLPKTQFQDATMVMAEAMNEVSRISEEELAFLRKATELLDLSFDTVVKTARPGVKEYELWVAVEEAIVGNGGVYPHFMIATSARRPLFPRAPPSHQTLASGDIIIFEINSTYGGVSPQICYAISLGRPEKDIEAMFEFCLNLYNHALGELEKGNKTYGKIELELAKLIHDAGYEPMTPQMHMMGISTLMLMNDRPKPGDYFIVHPNLCYKDYTAGAKFGDSIRIKKDGKIERLQRTQAKLHII